MTPCTYFFRQFITFIGFFEFDSVPTMNIYKNTENNKVVVIVPNVKDTISIWNSRNDKFKEEFEPDLILTCFPWVDDILPGLDGIINIVSYTSLGEELKTEKWKHLVGHCINKGWVQINNKNDWVK